MTDIIPNYGWVPFPFFQHVLIIALLTSYSNYKKINEYFKEKIYSKIKNKNIKEIVKIIISLTPIFIILYLDLNYSSFSLKNLGVLCYISNTHINSILKLVGGYGLVHFAAQDMGLKTCTIQSYAIKMPFAQFFIYIGVAFSLTQDRSMAIIATLLYFQIKYFISTEITNDVCFE